MANSLKTLGEDFSSTKSEKSFNELYNRIKPGLLNYINKITRDRDAAEDLFSMTMAIVYNKIHQFNPEYHISTWIYRIGYHEAIMFLRRKKRAATTNFSVFDSYYDNDRMTDKIMYNTIENEPSEEDFQTLQEREYEMQAKHQVILDTIEMLDPLYKEIVKDRLVREMKYGDISKKHKLPLHTIKNRIARGKRTLQSHLKELQN
jgi:RNA polymerase sigma-70 factor, ECF subfamily